jgi:Na+/melibiose symporter-like transporter
VYGIIDGGEHGFDRPSVWAWTLAGLAILAGFVAWERRRRYPALDVRLFRNPRFSAASAAIGLVFFAAMGSFFFVSFYLQLVRGYSPLETGLLMLPFAVTQLICAPLSAVLAKRYGAKAVAATGLLLTALSLVGLVWVGVETPIWLVAGLFAVQGVGMANTMPPSMESIMSSLPRERAGVASAVANTLRQVATALGVAVLGSLVASVYRGDMTGAVQPLPEPLRDAATESVSATYAVAERLGAAGAGLIDAANDAFVGAMHWAAAVATAVTLLGAFVVLRWLPGRAAPADLPHDDPAGAVERGRADEPDVVVVT